MNEGMNLLGEEGADHLVSDVIKTPFVLSTLGVSVSC